ncbi:MAG TPA: MaoC family dehydratase [Burkholderiaceae bacterium]|nr:MaoC family dehydratase [Burkholderiaceae bacterium]
MSAVTEREIVKVGETFARTVRFTEADIVAFAAACHDSNPLHHNPEEAAESRYGELIASGPHTASMLMGLAASHFSRRDDGIKRQMVCLNFNFAYKAPVYANEDITLHWVVSSVEWNRKLEGYVVMVDGAASTERSGVAVISRGTLLVKEVD